MPLPCPAKEEFNRLHQRASNEVDIGIGEDMQHATKPILLRFALSPSSKSETKIQVDEGSANFSTDLGLSVVSGEWGIFQTVEVRTKSQDRLVCALKKANFLRYTIYGTTPIYDTQDPSSIKCKGGENAEVYGWFTAVRETKDDTNVKLYRITKANDTHHHDVRNEKEEYACQQVRSDRQRKQTVIQKGDQAAILVRHPDTRYNVDPKKRVLELTIAPGIDPCISICIATVVEVFHQCNDEFGANCCMDCDGCAVCCVDCCGGCATL